MEFGVLDFFELVGALGFFIYGMKVMSDSLQQVAGAKMRQILGAMTTNRFTGVFTGFLITAIIQSSSATTVMTVSFVNAGLLSLIESAGVMMGANIGTTITGWLVNLIGFKVKIAPYALPIIAIGFPMMMLAKTQSSKKWGEFIVGFALLFLGLSFLKGAVPDIKHNPEVLNFLQEYAEPGLLTRLMFVVVGTVLTVIVQSSSAAMTLTLVLVTQGLPVEIAAAMILGENIGTTITAELASMIANVHAKRSARIHSLFNIVGVTWMVLLMPFFIDLLEVLGGKIFANPTNADTLAMFHTGFNFMNVIICIGFVPLIVKLSIKSVPSRGDVDEQYQIEYISSGLMSTPELSIMEAKKEIIKFGKLTARMNGFVEELLQEPDQKITENLLAKIKKYEEITDRIEIEVADYLSQVSRMELSEQTSIRIRGMLSIIGDLERMGDIYYQMSKGIERKIDQKVYFTPEQRNNVLEMMKKVEKAQMLMIDNLVAHHDQVTIDSAREMEEDINKYRNQLRKDHLKSIEKGDYNVKSGMVYSDLFSSCEKIGDHIINVTEGVIGEV